MSGHGHYTPMKLLSKFALILASLSFSTTVVCGPVKAGLRESVAQHPQATSRAAPAGIGGLNVGMTREEIEAQRGGDISLTAPLTLAKYGSPKEPNEIWYDSRLQSPLTEKPADVLLVFKSNVLTYMSVTLDGTALSEAERQLTAKYGLPKVDENKSEEQCLYKNGANFKLPKYRREATWNGNAEVGFAVQTKLRDIDEGMCPTNLRYDTSTSFKLKSLSFSKVEPKEDAPKKPVF